jgi:hypothetical protein
VNRTPRRSSAERRTPGRATPGRTGPPDEHRHRDQRVEHQRGAERERHGPPDGARRVADLLAQQGDPGVAGEREEQQAAGLQHPVRPCWQCGIACHKNIYEAVPEDGKRKAGKFYTKFDYEPLDLLTVNLGIYDQHQALEIVELVDQLGFDAISLG